MSGSYTESSASSFSSAGGSSIASDNADARVLNALQSGPNEDSADDVVGSNRSFQEAVFSTVYTLTKNKTLDSSIRVAVLKVVLEYLQLFRILFNTNWAWSIHTEYWIFKAIRWVLFKQLVLPHGYDSFVAFFYFLAALILVSILATVWVAVVLKGDDASNVWVKRLIGCLQLFAMVIYTIFWVAILDYGVFFFNCEWTNLSGGHTVYHIHFTGTNCLAMPHIAHMLFAGFLCIVFCGMTLMMSAGYTDLNPMTRHWLASSDVVASFKILTLKMFIVIVGGAFDCVAHVQVVLVLLAVYGVTFYHFVELPYYVHATNVAWTGLWAGLLATTLTLVNLTFTWGQHAADKTYASKQTFGILYSVLFSTAVGSFLLWARVRFMVKRVSVPLHAAFDERKQIALAGNTTYDKARASGSSVVALMGDLKKVYRYRDARQVSVLCRDMRRWDDDGIPDPDAAEYGEFVLKSGMARMPSNPALLVMYASFLIEVRKDGQGARTQLQLAQKANASWLDTFNIYVAQQLSKQLRREGDGLDLMGYVEYQRNYRACVRVHKLALMAQRAFWNTLLRSDKISFKDMQRSLAVMEETEARATATYRRAMERYPNNGRLMKVYGRFLEYVRNEPWTASRFYDEAMKQGTTESLLSLTRGQGGESAAGTINEKVDGLVIINAQGIIMMVNAATVVIFGYNKGDLEGKNVSLLMPQPISTQHNSFLQRYVESGQPHILDKSQTMVALHKDRSMFPITLCVTRLAGVGSDTLFMGVLRRAPPATAEGSNAVRFWSTASGLIMCADATVGDSFGLDLQDLVGQRFSNLCVDAEEVNRFIASAGVIDTERGRQLQTVRAQILHKYLPAVDVEISIQHGGCIEKGSDCRIFVIQVLMLSESQATLALDQKGHVVYATDKLSTMLGYTTAALGKMELNSLLPQPFCQMHGAWFRDLSRRPSPTSCRSGSVVHLLAANGSKVPVTLKMSTKEASNSGRPLHIIQVFKSSDSAQQDQQRLLLGVNHKGTILQVNPGVSNTLFGFEGPELVGRPLAAIVDVFGLWRHKYGDDSSLLAMLAFQAMSNASSAEASDAGASRGGADSWRVGIHRPVKDDDSIVQHAAKLAAAGGHNKEDNRSTGVDLLEMLQQRNRLIPACMTVDLAQHDAMMLTDTSVADTIPVIQVSLRRSDALTAIVELDKHLGISHAEDSAGLMFGISTKQLLKKSFPKLIGLPASAGFEDLLGTKGHPTAKKGAMKSTAGATATARMGLARKITVNHLGDGKQLTLEMQAMSYHRGGKTRMLVRLQLYEPSSASMTALVALKEGKAAAEAATAARLALADGAAVHGEGAGLRRTDSLDGEQSEGEEDGKPAGRLPLAKGSGPTGSFNRTSDWIRETSALPESPVGPPDDPADEHHGQHHRGKHSQQHMDGEEAAVYVSTKPGAKGANTYKGARASATGKGAKSNGYRDKAESDSDDIGGRHDWKGGAKGSDGAATSAPGSAAESASEADGASVADGASEAGGVSVSSAAEGHDEDLAVDVRRSKRLKKLNRMVQSSVAQSASIRWKHHTLGLLGAVLVVHILCFVVLIMQIDSRYKNATDVANMARALDKYQAAVLRAQVIQKCYLPDFKNISSCTATSINSSMLRLTTYTELAAGYHKALYLGASGLQPFADPRLLDYWTFKMLPEQQFLNVLAYDNGTVVSNVVVTTERSLWEMGNVMIADARDVHFNAPTLDKTLGTYGSFQYIMNNGPASIFQGYAWSLDIFVDYAWQNLQTLSVTLIVLLVVEAVVVLLGCMAYEFYLLQKCNVAHMHMFSVFLALPSATVRIVAQRQLQVDDDTKEDLDDDDMELAVDAGGTGAGTGAGAAEGEDEEKANASEKKKSVRIVVDESSSDEEDGGSPRGGHGKHRSSKIDAEEREWRSSGKSKGKSAGAKVSQKPPVTSFALFFRQIHKFLFGWMDPHFKRNGKKLVADSRVIAKFMVPLILWMIAVVIVFGVSYTNLQGLQGPLASLDTAAHVLYRMSRTRLFAGMLAFAISSADNSQYRAQLNKELIYFRKEYNTLMYGGQMILQANVSFDPVAKAGAFSDQAIADLFFRTKDCIRIDQSTCILATTDPYYDITHSGLDTMVNRYLDDVTAFALLPDSLAFANHTLYVASNKFGGSDMYDGLQTACDLFVAGTIAKFERVKMLHIILLVASLVCMLMFVVVLYRPYIKLLHRDGKAVAGMLSQLPAEVDVEGHVKAVILGSNKPPATAVGQATLGLGGPDGYGMGGGMGMAGSMPGQAGGALIPANPMGMHMGPPPGPGVPGYGYGYRGGSAGGSAGWGSQQGGARGPQAIDHNMLYMQDGPEDY